MSARARTALHACLIWRLLPLRPNSPMASLSPHPKGWKGLVTHRNSELRLQTQEESSAESQGPEAASLPIWRSWLPFPLPEPLSPALTLTVSPLGFPHL